VRKAPASRERPAFFHEMFILLNIKGLCGFNVLVLFKNADGGIFPENSVLRDKHFFDLLL
jgi:hypothetical protein